MDKIGNFKFWIQTKIEALIKAKEVISIVKNSENAKLIEYEITQYRTTLQKLEEFEYEYNKKEL